MDPIQTQYEIKTEYQLKADEKIVPAELSELLKKAIPDIRFSPEESEDLLKKLLAKLD